MISPISPRFGALLIDIDHDNSYALMPTSLQIVESRGPYTPLETDQVLLNGQYVGTSQTVKRISERLGSINDLADKKDQAIELASFENALRLNFLEALEDIDTSPRSHPKHPEKTLPEKEVYTTFLKKKSNLEKAVHSGFTERLINGSGENKRTGFFIGTTNSGRKLLP